MSDAPTPDLGLGYDNIKDAPDFHRRAAWYLISGMSVDEVAEEMNVVLKSVEALTLYPPFMNYVLDTRLEIAMKRNTILSLERISELLEAMEQKPLEVESIAQLVPALKEYTNTLKEIARRIPGWGAIARRVGVREAAAGDTEDSDRRMREELRGRFAELQGAGV